LTAFANGDESADELAGRDHEPHEIMAKLDIAGKRLPQDGRIMIKYKADGKKKELDFRVSTFRPVRRKRSYLRLLDKKTCAGHDQAGFRTGIAEEIRTEHFKAYGMVLVTGADGFGRRTPCIRRGAVEQVDTNIMTAEDPV